MSENSLTYETLQQAFVDGAAAIRARTQLSPAGGPADKIFPPTFGERVRVTLPEGSVHPTKYAVEERRVNGDSVLCVLLDSVASQANRMEEALQRAWDDGRLRFPLVRVDFTEATDDDPALDLSTLGGDGYLSALEAPHRLADALLRDSLLDDLRFRASGPGRAFTESNPLNATAVYSLCPTALVFGMWDSTGPKGGGGSKFQRALVSEIVGFGVNFGRKTASRIDPAGIELNAGPVYKSKDPDEEWTLDEREAAQEKKKPVPFSRRGAEKPGRPSSINHGNIMPTIESEAGGVTIDYAEQITVLSFPALRRLRFPKDVHGNRVGRDQAAQATGAAQIALAALGLAAVASQRDDGFDLRSRCALVPNGPLAFEILDREGQASSPYSLSSSEAAKMLEQAASVADRHEMGWNCDPLDLKPAPKLVELIRKSREVAAAAEADGEGE